MGAPMLALLFLIAGCSGGLLAAVSECNSGCARNQLTMMDPSSPEVQSAHIESIKKRILRKLGLREAPRVVPRKELARAASSLMDEAGAPGVYDELESADRTDYFRQLKTAAVFADNGEYRSRCSYDLCLLAGNRAPHRGRPTNSRTAHERSWPALSNNA